MKKILAIMLLAGSILCFAAEPIPVLTNPDRDALNDWGGTKPDVREFAAAFGIKFPAVFGSKTADFGLFKCYVDDNVLSLSNKVSASLFVKVAEPLVQALLLKSLTSL